MKRDRAGRRSDQSGHDGIRIRLTGVGRRYGLRGPWVLRGVDLEVPGGALWRVDGVNGSGKSTLLRLLAGIDAPSEGRVAGRPRTAYVPERFPARLPFTAIGYLTHLGRVHGLPRAAAERGAREWLERFGAAQHLRTPLSELSKGTSQKVAVTQALLAAPDLLLLDEAWTGLDAAARTELDSAVLERTAAGGAVVFVDHDPRRLAGAGDAAYTVADGTVRRTSAQASVGRVVVIETTGPWQQDRPAFEPSEDHRTADRAHKPPTGPHPVTVTRTPAGTFRLTVSAADSDAVLRGLLTAHPPWHVVCVTHAATRNGISAGPRAHDEDRAVTVPATPATFAPASDSASVDGDTTHR